MERRRCSSMMVPLLSASLWIFGSGAGLCFCHREVPVKESTITPDLRGFPPGSEYDRFGQLTRATGPMGDANRFLLPGRSHDQKSDLVFYGYRYYNASSGRWLSRDPIKEKGGENLFGFVGNDPVRSLDALGKLQIVFAGSGVLPLRVDVVPTLTGSEVCHGGPLHFTVNFTADYNDEGNRWMQAVEAWFAYGGSRIAIINFRDYPMRWDVVLSKPLPVCPIGPQSGSLEFSAGEAEDGQVLSIIFDWHYRCDCQCNEVEPFKPSYTYFVFPPLKPPPPPAVHPIIL